jgi:hypothetical protein
MGLFLGTYKGLREVYHGGATAAYRAFLTHFPSHDVSVAILCNAGSANAERYAHQVADIYLGDALRPEPVPPPVTIPAAALDAVAGMYRNVKRGVPLVIVRDGAGLKEKNGPSLTAVSPTRFRSGTSVAEIDVAADGRATRIRIVTADGGVGIYDRVEPATPTVLQLRDFEGTYRSDEAEATLRAAVEDGRLVIKRRPDRTLKLEPLYADAFDAGTALIRFIRDRKGAVTHMSVGSARAWDIRFERVPDAPVGRPARRK